MGILVRSTAKAMTAAVAIYWDFFKLKAIRNAPLRAPPVPINPARKPETLPPNMEIFFAAGNFKSGFNKDNMENKIRDMPKTNFRISCEIKGTKYAPMTVKITLGTPKSNINFIFRLWRKKMALPEFPKTWKKATSINAAGKSTKKRARGKNMVEEPKPAVVPITSARKATKKKKISFIY